MVARIKYGGLAGRDGALRFVEGDSSGGGVDGADFGCRRFVAIANAHFGLHRPIG